MWHNVVMNAANAQIGEWLGVKTPATDTEILNIVEKQLAPTVIKRLVTLGLERSEVDAIIIPVNPGLAGKEILGRFEQLSKKLGATIVLSAGNRLELGTTTESNAAPARVRATA